LAECAYVFRIVENQSLASGKEGPAESVCRGDCLPLPHQAKIVFFIYLTNDIFYSYISSYSIENRKRVRTAELGLADRCVNVLINRTGKRQDRIGLDFRWLEDGFPHRQLLPV
jgi:hypothetical protein